jgi:hypothetical protein
MAVSFIISRLRGRLPTVPQSGEEPYQRNLEVREGISNCSHDSNLDHRKRKNEYLMSSVTHVNAYTRKSSTAGPQCDEYQKTSQQLSDSLAELAEGTTIMGKPQRTERQYGVIGGHRNVVTSWPPVSTQISSNSCLLGTNRGPRYAFQYNTAGVTALTSRPALEAVEPIAVGPKRRQEVEVQTYSSPLSAKLTKLYASIMSSDVEHHAPPTFFDENPGSFSSGTEVTQPQLRTKREPLAVSYYNEEDAFAKRLAVVENKTRIMVGILEKCTSLSKRSGIASPLPVGQAPRPKGWARLRLRAPPAINTALANAAFDGQ